MSGLELWKLADFFQRFTPGYPADERWVRESDIAAERSRLRNNVEAMRDKRKADLDTMRSQFIAGEVNAFDRVLALLAEPGEDRS